MKKIDFSELMDIATVAQSITAECVCIKVPLMAWRALPPGLDLGQLAEIGTLVDDPYVEATFEEFHPDGTRYDSEQAPIAPRYYPYNLCQIIRCTLCQRVYLRYNEAGGYFTEIRVRALRPALLNDAAWPAAGA